MRKLSAPPPHGLDRHRYVAVSRDHDDADIGVLLSHFGHQVEPIAVWQPQIDQQRVIPLPGQGRARFRQTRYALDREPLPREIALHAKEGVFLIVDD